MKNELIAMILAGGQGTRLGVLTETIAKPAVPFGGKYRIIDFTLSNCINSGIHTVGVMTQYQPLELNDHIGKGEAWGFNAGMGGGATILQPYSNTEGENWFQGTAHAIYQNIGYIDSHQPEHVLILSGDHIYKMDYSRMLEAHKENQAKLTVGVLPVPIEEASRFGIMNTDESDRIIEFEEKPDQPKSNLASMGIYIFEWETLRNYLLDDQVRDKSLSDFGHDVIPQYLSNDEACFAYAFNGYWKDVGTIQSLWESNMEFLDPNHPLHENEEDWRIYTKSMTYPPQFLTAGAQVEGSLVTDGCLIAGRVTNSVVSQNVHIGENSVVEDTLVMSNVEIGSNCQIEYAIIGEGARILDGASIIGHKDDIAVVGYKETVGGPKNDGEE